MEVEILKKKDVNSYIDLIDEVFGYKSTISNIDKLRKDSIVLIAKKDSVVIGSVVLKEEYEYIKDKKYYHLSYLAVKKEFRRERIASMLFDKVEELVKENNINYIELSSGNQRRQAHYFYKDKEFKIKDTTVFVKIY